MSLLINNVSTVQKVNSTKIDEKYFLFDYNSRTVLNSGNLVNWSVSQQLPGTATVGNNFDYVEFNNHFITIGYDANTGEPMVVRSTDVSNWEAYANGPFASYSLAASSTLLLTAGFSYNGSNFDPIINMSTDGLAWSQVSSFPIQQGILTDVKYVNNKFYAHGIDRTNALQDKIVLCSSTDGSNWTNLSSAFDNILPGYLIVSFDVFEYVNNKFIALSQAQNAVDPNASSLSVLLKSTDGINWTVQQTASLGIVNSLAYNGKYAICNNNGEIWQSADLINWTLVHTFTNKYVPKILSVNNKFICPVADFATSETAIFESYDLTSWSQKITFSGKFYFNIGHKKTENSIEIVAADIPGVAPIYSPNFIGTPTVPTQPSGTNNTTIASTEFVVSSIAAVNAGGGGGLGYTPVNKAGDTMTGLLILSSAPTSNLGAATKQYVDTTVATAIANLPSGGNAGNLNYTPVNKAGDTMTGPLVLNGDPAAALGAATKQFVEAQVASKLSLAGGTMVGTLVLSGNPTAASPSYTAATKQYVDNAVSGINGGVTSFNSRTGAIVLNQSDIITALGYTFGTMATQNANAVTITGGTLVNNQIGGATITSSTVNGVNVGTNAGGNKTVSTSGPSGGSNGDVWYEIY